MSETITVQERIYDASMQVTELVDFGLDLFTVLTQQQSIPPQGLRVNVSVQGELMGPKIGGKITGIDYMFLIYYTS